MIDVSKLNILCRDKGYQENAMHLYHIIGLISLITDDCITINIVNVIHLALSPKHPSCLVVNDVSPRLLMRVGFW